jgi:hypothetical protein
LKSSYFFFTIFSYQKIFATINNNHTPIVITITVFAYGIKEITFIEDGTLRHPLKNLIKQKTDKEYITNAAITIEIINIRKDS